MAKSPQTGVDNGAGAPANGAADSPAPPVDTDSLDRVRNILFGQKARDLDARVSRTEERILREVADLRAALELRVSTLEGFVKEEVASLGRRIAAEQEARGDSHTDLESGITDLGRSLERKLAAAKDENDEAARALRQAVLDRSTELREELSAKAAELFTTIEREAALLRDSKTDRSALAALLNDVALRLSAGDDA